MKKLLLLFIATSFVLSQNLIEDVIERYENGNIKVISYHQKIWQKIELVKKETYHENGQMASIGNFKDGKEDGKWIYYTEIGNGRYEVIYTDGTYDVVTFINNLHQTHTGILISEDTSVDGQYLYQDQTNYDFSIYPKVFATIKDEKEDGKWTWYYENGQIEREGSYKDGEIEGRWRKYYKNGQIWGEGNFKDGKEDGKHTRYYENGQIEEEENFKDGELVN